MFLRHHRGVSPEDQEELAYLEQALTVLRDSVSREENPDEQAKLREYIRDIESRILPLKRGAA